MKWILIIAFVVILIRFIGKRWTAMTGLLVVAVAYVDQYFAMLRSSMSAAPGKTLREKFRNWFNTK
jgi:hypothetical protein